MSNYVQDALLGASPYKKQQEESKALVNKWDKTGLLDGLNEDFQRSGMAVMLENQAKQLINENSATGGGAGTGTAGTAGSEEWSGVALPLVRRIFGEIAAQDFVSVQPMNLPSGLVFYLDFKYGKTTAGTQAEGFCTDNNFTVPGGTVDSLGGKTGAETPPNSVAPFGVGGLYGEGRYDYSMQTASLNVATASALAANKYITSSVTYKQIDNIVGVTSTSNSYLLQEIEDERYELIFGDNVIGRKLSNSNVVTASYIVTDGKEGNGASEFSFVGNITNQDGAAINADLISLVSTDEKSRDGDDIESISSIKYFAPRIYSSQYRAVTSRDYESIIKKIYPNTESISIIGGEELDPPEFGTVSIVIKPKNGTFVSDFNKRRILSDLKQYSISGINQKILDLKLLYVEIDSSIYFNYSQVSTEESLKTKVTNSLTKYSESVDLNTFGGRLKYSKLLQVIDSTDNSITSNITKIRIRRDLKAVLNQFAQYELCFGNQFHVNLGGYNIKSTGFKISGEADTVYFTDVPNEDKKTGVISIVKPVGDTNRVIVKSAGTVDYVKGEIVLTTINITSTSVENGIIEIQAFPESNDVIGLKDLYLNFDISKSTINMVRDVIASGDEISGTLFVKDFYTSSYSNGNLIRK